MPFGDPNPGGFAPQSVQQSIFGWANVADFGAVGDDVTDDAPAIQSAIDSVGQGGVVYLPPRTYRLGATLVLAKGATLTGGGGWHPRYPQRTNMATYLRPAVPFVGTELIRVDPVPPVGGGVTDSAKDGAPRIVGLALLGRNTHNNVGGNIAGVACTAGVKDLVITDVTAWKFTGAGFSLADATGVLRSVISSTNEGAGFTWSSMLDLTLWECYAGANNLDGFVMPDANAVTLVQCRSEFNGGYGYNITGTTRNLHLVACDSDRNVKDGFLLAHNGGRPVILVACRASRDGKNDNVTAAGYAGYRVAPPSGTGTGAILTGCNAYSGPEDDGSGLRSPEYGLRADANANRVSLAGGEYVGTTAGIQDNAIVVARAPGLQVGTDAAGVVTISNSDRLAVLGSAGTTREVEFWSRGGGKRWSVRASSTAEAGASAGSDFEVSRYDDTGVFVDTAFSLSRKTGIPNIKAGIISLPAAGAAPTTGPTLYTDPTGALKFRSAAGTVTTIAPA